jgi:hypothetical protein
MKFILSIIFLITAACGQTESNMISANDPNVNVPIAENSQNEARPAYAIANAASLPACNQSILGQVIYTIDDNKFQYCSVTGWQTINQTTQQTTTVQASQTSVNSFKIEKEWTGFGFDELCTDGVQINPAFTFCYLKDLKITKFSGEIFHYTFILYTADSNGSDTKTYTGFSVPTEDGLLLIDLLMHDTLDGEYRNYWFSWRPGNDVGYIVVDSEANYEPSANDQIIAEVTMY